MQRPPVGQSNDTLLFDASWSENGRGRTAALVLRRQPSEHPIFHDPDVVREFRVLEALRAASRVPVPEVYWSEPDASVLGAPFFVMERVSGRVPAGWPKLAPPRALPSARNSGPRFGQPPSPPPNEGRSLGPASFRIVPRQQKPA